MNICVSKLVHNCFRKCLGAWRAPSHFLHYCWHIINWAPRKKFSELGIQMQHISYKKNKWKVLSAECRPFLLALVCWTNNVHDNHVNIIIQRHASCLLNFYQIIQKKETTAAIIQLASLTAIFMVPRWGPAGADRTQVGPMLVPWTLLSGLSYISNSNGHKPDNNCWMTNLSLCKSCIIFLCGTAPFWHCGFPLTNQFLSQ